MSASLEVEEKLKALEKRFRDRLDRTLQTVQCMKSPDDLLELSQLSHKLAGTAGTYGFHDLSRDMKALEHRIRDYKESEMSADEFKNLYQEACEILESALGRH